MKDIGLIITDLDNTLLNHNKEITPFSEEVFKKLRERGIIVCYASARPKRTILPLFKFFHPDYIIADNGAKIYSQEDLIREAIIDRKASQGVVSYLCATPSVTYLSVEMGEQLLVSKKVKEMDFTWKIEQIDFRDLTNIDSTKMTFECDDDAVADDLACLFPEICIQKIERRFSTTQRRYHIFKAGISKLEALKSLLDRLKLNLSDVIAFGDDLNDLGIIESSVIGIAVDNAIEAVRSIADEICDSCNEDGVAKWIETFVL